MRYTVKQYGTSWGVYDNTLSFVVSYFDTQAKAQKYADKLNANPPPDGAKRKWYLTRSAFNNSEDLLNQGWEPFSSSDGFIYFRKDKK